MRFSRRRLPHCWFFAALFIVLLPVEAAIADSVNPANITTFVNGQPALAGEVNGNFGELIAQINDHAARLADVESTGVVLGDNIVSADCDVDGPDALHDAINNAPDAVGTLTVLASGACSEVAIFRRGVVIQGTDLSITADSSNARADSVAMSILASDVRMFPGPGSSFFRIDGNGEPGALALNQDAQVLLIGVTIDGATDIQVGVSAFSTLAFLGSNTVGNSGDGAVGLNMLQSRVLLITGGPLSFSTLDLNSSGPAINALSSTFLTLELIPGSTQLAIPNSPELDFTLNSTGIFGPFTFGSGAGEKLRVSDSSSVLVDGSALFGDGDTATILSDLVLDRGSVLRLDFEEAPQSAGVTHGGNVELGVNSVIDLAGKAGASDRIEFATGIGTVVDVNVNSSLVVNSSTFAADTLNVLNSTVAFANGSIFDDGQPTINVSYEGTVFDLAGVLTGSVASCVAGGSAYDSVPADVCP